MFFLFYKYTLQFTTLVTILVFTLLTKIFRLLTLQYYTKHHLHYNTKHKLQSEPTCLLRLAVITLHLSYFLLTVRDRFRDTAVKK